MEKKLSPPIIIYADIEAVLKSIEVLNRSEGTGTTQQHEACAVSYYVKHVYNEGCDEQYTFVETCIAEFLNHMQRKMDDLYQLYWTNSASPKELLQNEQPTEMENIECCACEEIILGYKDNYFTGEFVGFIHRECRECFQFKLPYFPVIFHNLSRYDVHLFITQLGSNLSVIPCNKELYISITKRVMEGNKINYLVNFVDSNRFLNSSLEKLAKYLQPSQFKVLKKAFKNPEKFALMSRRGVFPYDYVSDIKKLDDPILPSRECFYNYLSDRECSDADYNFARTVWDALKCQPLKDYMVLYLESDVLILTDVFENFRILCLEIYKLDPCNYVTAPSLSWDAMLKYTKVEMELIVDPEIHTFLKTNIRGGLTQCTQKLSESNNKFNENYDESKSENYLYGWAMSQKLPYANFQFLSESEVKDFDIYSIDIEGTSGYILEVDLNYPSDIHDQHDCLPFSADNKIPLTGKYKKLIADLTHKMSYKIHLNNLLLCLQHGLQLKCIHRILKFTQRAWLEPYISLNTNRRKVANNEFEKNFYKLMHNAVYGKTMENGENRRDVRLVNSYENRRNSEGYRALIAKPNFKGIEIFDNGLYGVELNKLEIIHNKPIYVGVTVLELSKKSVSLPKIQAILDRLREAQYMSSLDLKDGYWQIPLEATSTAGRGALDSVIGPDMEPHAFAYLHDIIVFGKTLKEHLANLREVFRRQSANQRGEMRAHQEEAKKAARKLCMPTPVTTEVLRENDDEPTAAHLGGTVKLVGLGPVEKNSWLMLDLALNASLIRPSVNPLHGLTACKDNHGVLTATTPAEPDSGFPVGVHIKQNMYTNKNKVATPMSAGSTKKADSGVHASDLSSENPFRASSRMLRSPFGGRAQPQSSTELRRGPATDAVDTAPFVRLDHHIEELVEMLEDCKRRSIHQAMRDAIEGIRMAYEQCALLRDRTRADPSGKVDKVNKAAQTTPPRNLGGVSKRDAPESDPKISASKRRQPDDIDPPTAKRRNLASGPNGGCAETHRPEYAGHRRGLATSDGQEEKGPHTASP
ncbi:uncharacterized protein ACN427_011393 [Glossina fuscipes fuscipes]